MDFLYSGRGQKINPTSHPFPYLECVDASAPEFVDVSSTISGRISGATGAETEFPETQKYGNDIYKARIHKFRFLFLNLRYGTTPRKIRISPAEFRLSLPFRCYIQTEMETRRGKISNSKKLSLVFSESKWLGEVRE